MEPFIDAIRRFHGCHAVHVDTVPVHEKAPDGRTLWDGVVAPFDLVDFPKAKRCYVWNGRREGEYIIFLHSEKINSPSAAVLSRAVLGSKSHD